MEQQYNPQGLKEVLLQIGKEENYKEILSTIFELNFNNKKSDLLVDLISSLNEAFMFDCNELVNYFFINGYLTAEQINISDVGVIKFVNLLKRKYGYTLRKESVDKRDPLAITKFSSNLINGMSYTSIYIGRNDGEVLEGICTTQQLLGLITPMNDTIVAMINDGVYNIDINTLKLSLDSTQRVLDKLQTLLSTVRG